MLMPFGLGAVWYDGLDDGALPGMPRTAEPGATAPELDDPDDSVGALGEGVAPPSVL